MPAQTHTEFAIADTITIVCTRIRTTGNAIDWTLLVNAQITESNGNIVVSVTGLDLASLLSAGNITTIKGLFNTAAQNVATNRSILVSNP